MGTIILFVFLSILFAFISGVLYNSSDDFSDNKCTLGFIVSMCLLVLNICISFLEIQEYYENKEYSSTNYEFKKKVIRIEEDNTIKLDTVYTFTHR